MPSVRTVLRCSAGRRLNVAHQHAARTAGEAKVLAEIQRFQAVDFAHTDVRVGVVGGGLAGLYCAWLLNKANIHVTLWEASCEVGGRVRTLRDFAKNRLVEAGGEIIGLNHPRWLYLAKLFRLGMTSFTSQEELDAEGYIQPMILDGRRLSQQEMMQIEEATNAVYLRISAEASQLTFPSQPWLEPPHIQALDLLSVADKFDEWGVVGTTRAMLDAQFLNDNLLPTSEQSFLGLLCTVREGSDSPSAVSFWDAVERLRCSTGNQSLAFNLASEIPRVFLNSPVSSIQQSECGCIHIGETERVDFVVLAVPPTVWPDIEIANENGPVDLSPYLPVMAPAMKLLSKTVNRFWFVPEVSPYGFNNAMGACWEATDGQTVRMCEPQQIVFSMFAGSEEHALTRKKHMKQQINQLYKGRYKDAIIETKSVRWYEEPYIKTGYSCWAVGKLQTVKNLNFPAPEFDNRLVFAGEATSPSFFGYQEGGLDSGARAAVEILVLLSRLQNHLDFHSPFCSEETIMME